MYQIIKFIKAVIRRFRNIFSTFYWKIYLKKLDRNSKIYLGTEISFPDKVEIGCNSLIEFNSVFSSELPTGKLTIGNNVKINSNVFLDFTGGLEIDDDVVISKDTYIITHSHGYDPRSLPIPKPLKIGKKTWVGAKVIICENVSLIGENSIIAAGAVVTKNVEANTIVGGNPAKMLKVK